MRTMLTLETSSSHVPVLEGSPGDAMTAQMAILMSERP